MIRFGILSTWIDKIWDSCSVMYTREQSRKQSGGLPLDLTEGPGATSKNNKSLDNNRYMPIYMQHLRLWHPPSPPYTKG